MAFWSMTSSLSMAGATEKVLDRDSFTVKDLLDCDDILNQVLAPNERVINYLSQPEIVCELVDLATTAPPVRHAPESKEDDEAAGDGAGAQQSASEDGTDSETSGSKDDAAADSDRATAEGKEDARHAAESIAEHAKQGDDAGDAKGSKTDKKSGRSIKYEKLSDSGESVEYHEFRDDSEDTDIDVESDEEFEEEQLRQSRYAKISAEILTTDVWALLDALISNEEAMLRLWGLLDASKPDATTQQLALLTKILEGLLEKRLDRMLDFIKTLPHFVDYFIRYVECQPLVDFLIKVISTDHPESPTDVIEFLYEQELIPKMIELLGPDVSHSAQSAAGDFLKAFVNISGGNKSDICTIGPNEMSRQFVSYRCMNRLIELMLKGGHGMCVAVTVIIEVIRKNNSDYDLVNVMDTTLESHPPDPRDNIYLGTMVALFARAIPQFQKMLVAEESKTMKMPFGSIKPLGFERFRICELYAELLHCSNMNLLNDPRGLDVIKERDLERIRVYFPHREPPNEMPEQGGSAGSANFVSTAEQTDASERKAQDGSSSDTVDHIDHTGEDYLEESDSETPVSPAGGSSSPDLRGAHAPHEDVIASSPTELLDSPAQTPSPPTPEDESGDELEYGDDKRQKINVSIYRGEQLEQYLIRENRSLRRRAVVGDQLKFALDDNKCIDAVLGMLFEYPWNNFLHNVVFDIVQQVFNGYIDHSYNRFLSINLLTRAHLTDKIVKGQRANDEHESQKNIRLGYVGHLTLISEEVVKFESLLVPESVSPKTAEVLSEREWIEYVHNDLLQLREQYNTVLGKVSMVSEEEDSYDLQEDADRRALAIELNLMDESEAQFSQARQQIPESDSDSASGSDSDSESDSDDAVLKHGSARDDERTDDGLIPLAPQSHHIESEEQFDELNDDSLINPAALGREALTDASGKSNRDKIPKDEGEFARYMSRQLNTGQFSSASSDEEDEEEDKSEAAENESWIPVGQDANDDDRKD